MSAANSVAKYNYVGVSSPQLTWLSVFVSDSLWFHLENGLTDLL